MEKDDFVVCSILPALFPIPFTMSLRM